MGLFKTLMYVSLGKTFIEFVDKEIDKFIPKKETVYIVYNKEGKNENKESTKKEEPKFEEKVEKNNK